MTKLIRLLVACGILWPLIAVGDQRTLIESAALVASGAAVSLAVHEASHELAGLALGDHIEWKGSDWTVWEPHHRHVQVIAGAGFVAQAVLTEGVMDLLSPSNPFRLGAGGFYVVNSVQYMTRSWLAPDGYGDFSNFSVRDRAVINGILGAHVLVTCVRLMWPAALPAFIRGGGVQWEW